MVMAMFGFCSLEIVDDGYSLLRLARMKALRDKIIASRKEFEEMSDDEDEDDEEVKKVARMATPNAKEVEKVATPNAKEVEKVATPVEEEEIEGEVVEEEDLDEEAAEEHTRAIASGALAEVDEDASETALEEVDEEEMEVVARTADPVEKDDSDDEIDAFHMQRDVVPLDVAEGESADKDTEQPVFEEVDDRSAYDEENAFRMLVPVNKVGGVIRHKGEIIKKKPEELNDIEVGDNYGEVLTRDELKEEELEGPGSKLARVAILESTKAAKEIMKEIEEAGMGTDGELVPDSDPPALSVKKNSDKRKKKGRPSRIKRLKRKRWCVNWKKRKKFEFKGEFC